MPEEPENNGWNRRIRRLVERLKSKLVNQGNLQTGVAPQARLVLSPRTFAEGTAKRSYATIPVTSIANDYKPEHDVASPNSNITCFQPSKHDLQRAKGQPWLSLIERPLREGLYERCCGEVNSSNPFAFNTKSDKNYQQSYIHVFRKRQVLMPCDLYNYYLTHGLFDPDHTIGEPYTCALPLATHAKWVPVVLCDHPLEAYTAVHARPPPHWTVGEKASLSKEFKDISEEGYRTTIGLAQFCESLKNKINIEEALVREVRVGRPANARTGKPGRPRKSLTKDSLEKARIAAKRPTLRAPGRRPSGQHSKGPGNSSELDLEQSNMVSNKPVLRMTTRSRAREG